MIKLIIGEKVWEVSSKMAKVIVGIAKENYMKENVNAIVAVEKDGIITMQKDVFDNTDAFVKAVTNWERSGYKCYYISKKG